MQKKYEIMFVLKPNLTEDQRKSAFDQIAEAITKNEGKIGSARIWEEKRKLVYPIKKFREALYYFVEFDLPASAISKIKSAYKLNDNIIRLLISKLD